MTAFKVMGRIGWFNRVKSYLDREGVNVGKATYLGVNKTRVNVLKNHDKGQIFADTGIHTVKTWLYYFYFHILKLIALEIGEVRSTQ